VGEGCRDGIWLMAGFTFHFCAPLPSLIWITWEYLVPAMGRRDSRTGWAGMNLAWVFSEIQFWRRH